MATATLESPLIIPPTGNHTASVILYHGLGDTGEGWRTVTNTLSKDLPHVKWVLPHAPTGEVTAHNKKSMPRWFDIISHDFESAAEDRAGIMMAARMVDEFIQREVDAGVPPERVVVGGFSQGAAVVLLAGLTSRPEDGFAGGKEGWKPGGLVVLSGWLPLRNSFQELLSPRAAQMPIFWGHGTDDIVVRHKVADTLTKKLTTECGIPMVESLTLGTDRNARCTSTLPQPSNVEGGLGSPGLSFRSYQAWDHAVCPRELRDLSEFLGRVVP
ncbi:Phospholipase/Carboxylesterase-domain-containing protein [Pisolithus sp. B1]|nr:Phospholipase/Carboxylesterase-domain-containing protein [Pisolithus sp. B1]